MKKIITFLTLISIIASYGFNVHGAEVVPVMEMDVENFEKYPNYPVSVYNTDCLSVGEDESGEKYIAVDDNDASVGCGIKIITGTPSTDYITADFDYYIEPDSKSGAKLYWNSRIGNCVALTMFNTPWHYLGSASGNGNASGDILAGKWEHITVVIDRKNNNFDVYLNGANICDNFVFRDNAQFEGGTQLIFMGDAAVHTKFRIKNFKLYTDQVVPEKTEEMVLREANPERMLVDYAGAKKRLDKALGGAVAMTIGNSVARVNNRYVSIYEGEPYVAPYINADGSTLVPVRFVTESIGCEVEVLSLTQFKIHKDGTTIELNTGDRNAVINGQPVEMPTAPVITKDRLFVPLRFAAETFGKTVFWDDRGLIVIGDGEVVKAGDEDIIKPLISEIRSHTTVFGNTKYSDVSMSSRNYYEDTLEATKDFMTTVNRWTYTINGEGVDIMNDQGLIVQGTLNASVRDGDEAPNTGTAQFFDGTWYTRSDGANGTTWGCVSNPIYRNNILMRAKRGIDSGLYMWQFDDWQLSVNYGYGGCFCDICMQEFTKYLKEYATSEQLAAAEFNNLDSFNFKTWLKAKGVSTNDEATYWCDNSKPTGVLWRKFNEHRVLEFHKWLRAEMEAYAKGTLYHSINYNSSFSLMAGDNDARAWYVHMSDMSDGTIGESGAEAMTPGAVFSSMLLNKAIGIENCMSPWPKTQEAEQLMISAIPMAYATGQFILVPWDVWLYGAVRYYAKPEDMKGIYEFVRKYPYLFDNYEMPETIGYVMDLQATDSSEANNYSLDLLEKGSPSKLLLHRGGNYGAMTFDMNDLKGLQAIVSATDISNLTNAEKTTLETSGIKLISKNDTQERADVENALYTVRDNNPDVYSVLRTNQLYEDAPVIVHAVNYDYFSSKENVELEINNAYLPSGDSVEIKVHRPNENPYILRVRKGISATKVTLDKLDLWAVLQISGANTTRRVSSFDIGEDYSGIGLGTRISNDGAQGTPKSFNIITYGEGLNSTTLGDAKGCQDEAAFVYKHLGRSKIKSYEASAGFEEADGAHGVMIRDSVRSNSIFASLIYDRLNGLRFAHRDFANKGVVYTSLQGEAHEYMKLEKTGDMIVAYTATDGKAWKKVFEYTLEMAEPVAGVFASSPDGKKSVHGVKDFYVSNGKNPNEEFKKFTIKYKDGKITDMTVGEKLDFELSTRSNGNLTSDDADIRFTSSDNSVAEITPSGTIIPKKQGKVTVSAVARMGMKSITASTQLEVVETPVQMFKASFDDKSEFDMFKESVTAGKAELVDGAVRLMPLGESGPAMAGYMSFPQVTQKNAFFEFDFRAHFGTTQPTTGAGVLYGNSDGFAMTCDVGRFNWFFENDQRYVMDMEGDKWYHIKIYINYDEQYANVWVDDKLIVEKGKTKTLASPDGTFMLRAWRMGLDTYYEWDNFNVYFAD